MPQTFTEVETPFANMSFTPDVPSAALNPNEFNSGENVETDTRGIRAVLGDEEILSQLTGTPIFISSGYRANNIFWYIVATVDGSGHGRWYALDNAGITNVTPGGTYLTNYSFDLPITDSWNGTVLFINDSQHPPMYLTGDASAFIPYSDDPLGPGYIWNYNPDWSSLRANFMHLYSTPNVGSILIAGGLEATRAVSSIIEKYPTTVRWSQAFGLNSGPTTWAPTLTNIANEVEVPVRGAVVDGFPMGGNFYVCSYWDTVIFSPINYQNTNAPVLGIRLLTQGRGLLNENCWANADTLVYGLDARDIWAFDGSNFKSLGNQRVKKYFFENLNPLYSQRTYVINNTQKNQIEIYYPDLDSTGWCNRMLSYRYDLDIFNAPRDISSGSHAAEGPIFEAGDFNASSRTVVYTRGVADSYIVQKDRTTTFLGPTPIVSRFRRDNISLGLKYSQQALLHRILPEVVNLDLAGLPVKTNAATGNITVTVGGSNSVGQQPVDRPPVTMAIDTNNPWTQINQNAFRVNSIELGDTSSTHTWQCTAVNWQFTPTEDSR
jgi:hypothetical protein